MSEDKVIKLSNLEWDNLSYFLKEPKKSQLRSALFGGLFSDEVKIRLGKNTITEEELEEALDRAKKSGEILGIVSQVEKQLKKVSEVI